MQKKKVSHLGMCIYIVILWSRPTPTWYFGANTDHKECTRTYFPFCCSLWL